MQSHFHGRPHHCLVCSNSSALVLYYLENIKGAGQSGNQITANVNQGLGGWRNGQGAGSPFRCFNQKFPRPPPTRTVISNSNAHSHQGKCAESRSGLTTAANTYTEGYTKCSESLSRWLFNPSVTLLVYLSAFFKFVVIGLVVEAVGFKMSLLDSSICLGDKAQLAKDIAIRTQEDMCICILLDIELESSSLKMKETLKELNRKI